MKKVIFYLLLALILAIILVFAMSTVALAADGDGVAIEAEESPPDLTSGFITYAVLVTYSGCLTVTIFATQLLKSKWKWDIRILSYIIALVSLIAGNWGMGTLTLTSAGICVFNAVMVTLAANGGYDYLSKPNNNGTADSA